MLKPAPILAVFLSVWIFGNPSISRADETATEFDNGKASFTVWVKDLRCPYRVLALFVLPEESVVFQVLSNENRTFRFEDELEGVRPDSGGIWLWKAPETPGIYPVRIVCEPMEETMTFNVFVMLPYQNLKKGRINGYLIGEYPKKPLNGETIYHHPLGFVEANPKNENTPVSPHFRLAQFLCKQNGNYPKYLVLRTALLLKLEMILEEVNKVGHACNTLHIMSGYRTPHYNASIGNAVYSRHIWGGAADIYIDAHPKDNRMDDLNGDGRIDSRDSKVLYTIIHKLSNTESFKNFHGGLGRYPTASMHGPFVHVDVRGYPARWTHR